ncbi:Hsp70 family protein [Amycolatopsis sp. NPDC004079]|uniref:Hsp70 family protein n=1 Tax=Amycolatopsis sp. NPDC004079 TaxID=3154549 RepID=UPI0033A3768A
MARIVGIDLGTTYSAVACLGDDGNPYVIPGSAGEFLVPSVISFANGAPVVGAAAKAAQADGETRIAAAFKRHVGDPEFRLSFGGEDYDATDLSALVLAELKARAEAFLREPVARAVVTVPAYFTHPQRTATIEAGRRAGLDVVRVLSEPTAAAVAYGLRAAPDERVLAVYDLGGGTFDVSLVQIAEGELRVLGADGDHRLGGRDWDDRLCEYANDWFAREFGVEIADDDVLVLLARAEQLKHTLSARRGGEIRLDSGGRSARCPVTREKFEELTKDLVDRTGLLTERALADTGLDWSRVGGVIPVGGSTRMPMVSECIARLSGRPPLGGAHPDQAVALGAAIEAAGETRRSRPRADGPASPPGLRLARDVIAHSLGMIAESPDRARYLNSVLIRKNLPIPASQRRPFQFRLRDDGENLLEVFLTQGETDDPGGCAYLGRYVVTGFGPGSGDTVVDIDYVYDRSGVVHVEATDRGTARPLLVTVEAVPPDVPARFAGRPGGGRRGRTTVYLAFDLSGSMSGRPLEEAKRAAHAFAGQCDLSTTSIGLIAFSDRAEICQPATQNAADLGRAIDRLQTGRTGYSNLGHPFDVLHEQLAGLPGARYAVVLADGIWSRQDEVVPRAVRCREAGIETVAIGFGSADRDFLARIASSSEQSLFTDLNRLTESFSTIARELTEGRGVAALARQPE